MSIGGKIEEIRKQPEHIRMRWVWGAVAVSMFFIFMIWIFSIQVMFKKDSGVQSDSQSLNDTFNKIKETAPSLKDVPLTGNTRGTEGEGIQNNMQQADPTLNSSDSALGNREEDSTN